MKKALMLKLAVLGAAAGAFSQSALAAIDTTAVQQAMTDAQSTGETVGVMVIGLVAGLIVIGIVISLIKKA